MHGQELKQGQAGTLNACVRSTSAAQYFLARTRCVAHAQIQCLATIAPYTGPYAEQCYFSKAAGRLPKQARLVKQGNRKLCRTQTHTPMQNQHSLHEQASAHLLLVEAPCLQLIRCAAV